MANLLNYDGEHCPICSASAFTCGHDLTDENDMEVFADGLPGKVVERLELIQPNELQSLTDTMPQRLRKMVGIPLDGDLSGLSLDYWADDPGVVGAFFDADRPGGSEMTYWHRQPEAFEAGVRDEAKQILTWLDEHFTGD